MEEKKSGGLFWALLLLIGGGSLWVINKYIGSTKNTIKFPNLGNPKNTTPTKTTSSNTKPTPSKYHYGNSVMDGKATTKNINSDIVVNITAVKNRIIVGARKAKFNDYIINIGITNRLSTSITIEHIVLLFYINGSFKGYYEFLPSSITPMITIKPKSSYGNTVSITQDSYTRYEDMTKINLVDNYFDINPQSLFIRKSQYNSGYHWEGGDIIDPVTGAHSQNPNQKQVQDYSPDYVIDKVDNKFLEDLWNSNYTLNVKGFIAYRKYEGDSLDGGNLAYIDLITTHAVETIQPYTNRVLDGISAGSGGSGGATSTSKSKLGVSNFIN